MISEDPEDGVEQLLARVGKRAEPPSITRDAVYLSSLLAWQMETRRRRRRRWTQLAIAASITFMGLLMGWRLLQPVSSTVPTAVVAQSLDGNQLLRVGEMQTVTTSPGLVLRSVSNELLRLQTGTRFIFTEAGHLRLHSGAIYVESTSVGPNAGLIIDAGSTSIRHIGTRYAVAMKADGVSVSVRDGRVAIDTKQGQILAEARQQLLLDNSGLETGRQMIETHGSVWAWADSLAPPTVIDGRPLAEVLREIAYETGRALHFDSDDVRLSCEKIKLNGPFLDLAASERLFAVLVTTGLEAVESGDRILIRRTTESQAVSVAE